MLGQDVQDSEGETERTEKDRERERARERSGCLTCRGFPPNPSPKDAGEWVREMASSATNKRRNINSLLSHVHSNSFETRRMQCPSPRVPGS